MRKRRGFSFDTISNDARRICERACLSCCRSQYPYTENDLGYVPNQRGVRRNFKNEDTWCDVLWHSDAEYDSTRRVFNGWWYGWLVVRMLCDLQPLERRAQCERQPQRQRLERQLVVRWAPQLSSFRAPALRVFVLPRHLSAPTTELFAHIIKRNRERDVFVCFKRTCFPQDHEKNLECIEFSECKSYPGFFFLRLKKGCGSSDFNALNK